MSSAQSTIPSMVVIGRSILVAKKAGVGFRGGGELPYTKDGGVRRKFEPLRGTVFVGVAWNIFHP